MSKWLVTAFVLQTCYVSIAWLVSVIIAYYLAYHIVFQRIDKFLKIDTKIRGLSVSASILYCISLLSQLIGHIVNNSIYWEGIPYTISQITWVLANCCMYFLFMVRIHVTFKDTSYKIKLWIFIVISIFVFGYGIGELMFPFWELLQTYSSFNISNETDYKSYMIFNVVASDFIASVSLSILFISKLIAVARHIDDDTPISDDHSLILSKQYQMFYIITKQTIVSISGVCATQLLLLYNIYQLHVQSDDGDNKAELKYTLYTINGFLFSMDCVINSLMVILAFTYFSTIYHSVCGCCHRLIFRTLTKRLNTQNEDHVMLIVNK